MKILGIRREVAFSPNMAGDDAAIFMAVVDELRSLGHEVTAICEKDMTEIDYDAFDRVMTMARDSRIMDEVVANIRNGNYDDLSVEETNNEIARRLGKFINSLEGCILCTSKARMALEMVKNDIPQPPFKCGYKNIEFYKTTEPGTDITMPAWLKNSDTTAMILDDILFCTTKKDYNNAKSMFRRLDVFTWLLQQHQEGDLIKFYGVEGTDFFQWQYASQCHSKFNFEQINGKEQGYAFDVNRIKECADTLAKQLHVPIYGGDVVIGPNNQFWFIDFNDFPSFASCRERAAKVIAQRIINN